MAFGRRSQSLDNFIKLDSNTGDAIILSWNREGLCPDDTVTTLAMRLLSTIDNVARNISRDATYFISMIGESYGQRFQTWQMPRFVVGDVANLFL
jgi:hypothetical protein